MDSARYIDKLERQVQELIGVLKQIANHKHCQYSRAANIGDSYSIGVTDGHRCAAKIARDVLEYIGED